MARRLPRDARLTADVRAIIRELERFLQGQDDQGRAICGARCGVYAFYDYDGEPIYVGQTYERLRVRIRRHLTNQRTDAVAMHVLDPLEVARVEVWPMWEFEHVTQKSSPSERAKRKAALDAVEFTVHKVLAASAQGNTLLNEKSPPLVEPVELPPSYAAEIVPADVRERTGHSDERIARRAATTANLAQVVRERDVSLGLRRTLVTQARRLELLASRRFVEVQGETPAPTAAKETTRSPGEEDAD